MYSRFSVAGGLNCRYMQLFNFRRKPYWAKCQISWLLPKIKYTSSFCYNVLKQCGVFFLACFARAQPFSPILQFICTFLYMGLITEQQLDDVNICFTLPIQ